MINQDRKIILACIDDNITTLFSDCACEHPMDESIIKKLKQLSNSIRANDDDYELYRYREDIDALWGTLLEKAIKCLRYHDKREPFNNNNKKKPKAYGIIELKKYYEQYTEFEKVLYGSNRYYRDHVIHVFRTWLSGIELLAKNSGKYLDLINIQEKNFDSELTRAEKISMWTIIALTHDLGYPLQKAKSIINVTQNMLSTFITNPDISVDFSFHGVQNYMNDFIVRLMSSKMEKRTKNENMDESSENEVYVARLQSKYYFKFQKSLESNNHGILSTLIIYKLLTYFLESDYSINEDYIFNKEESRQFYIRREILRAIASHTCDDVYQMYMRSFSFLLRICDDTQEWGRKNISELYVKSGQQYELNDIALNFEDNPNHCDICEQITTPDAKNILDLIIRFRDQAFTYITIFRDGQDTASRDFSFSRELTIKSDDVTLVLTLKIDKDKASQIEGKITYTSDEKKNKFYGKNFFDNISKNCNLKVFGANNNEITEKGKEANWRKGEFTIPLMD